MVGRTKDVGWNVGVRKTVRYPVERVWNLLTGPAGLPLWLGSGVDFSAGAAKGDRYETAEGTVGEIRSFHAGYRVRLTWCPADWTHDTTLQLTLIEAASGTTVAVHQEWLADADERERQRTHWQAVVQQIGAALTRH